MYSEEKRKVKIKYMILTALILFLPIQVKAAMVDKTPTGAIINTAMNYQKNSTITEDYYGWEKTFTISTTNDSWKSPNDYIVSQQINYDFSDRQEEYFSFQLRTYNITTQGILKVNGIVCDNVSIGIENGTISSYYDQYPWTYQCKNPKSEAYIQWEIPNVDLTTNKTLILLVPKMIGFYNNEEEQLIIQQTQQDQTNWNNFNNQDKPGTSTNVDDTNVQNVEQQGQTQINGIESALQNIQAPQFDLTDFSNTFAWIWQTIIYLFTTHRILMTTMIIVMSLGFLKTVLGR